MLFTSFTFLGFFLPILILGFFLVPRQLRILWLTIGSLFFYFWGESSYWLLGYYIIGNYLLGILLEKYRNKNILWLGIVINLAPLLVYKYKLGSTSHSAIAAIPLGISFFFFQGVSYLADIHRGIHKAQKNILKYAFFKSFFAPLLAGPVFRYANIAPILEGGVLPGGSYVFGIRRFVFGLAKKVLIADQFAGFVDLAFKNSAQLPTSWAWLALLCFSIQIYYDFSGYSDMAIGLHEFFGLKIPENFHEPFTAISISEFWRRWHMTLTAWFKDYIYIPLGGNKKGAVRAVANKYIVFLLCGLWHGSTWIFGVWGLFHGTFLMVEFYLKKIITPTPFMDKAQKIFGPIYVLVVVTFSWIFFRAENSEQVRDFLVALTSLSRTANYFQPSFYVFFSPYYFILFFIALFLMLLRKDNAFGIKIGLSRWKQNYTIALLLFLLAMAMLIAKTHRPFIYFRF